MKRILVPVDFSPTSKRAFRYAIDIASRSEGTIILYHLFTPLKSGLANRINISEENKRLEKNILKRLQRLRKKLLANTKEDVMVSTLVGRTPLLNNILGFVEHNHIDLIVMGTQGASGLKKITLGSNASNVMKKSEIPVLLIPEEFEWKKPENILFTTTLSKSDNDTFPFLLRFVNLYDATITIVNLHKGSSLNDYKGKEEFEMYAYSVQRIFDHTDIQFRQLETFSVAETMENLYEEIPYDLLVMTRRKKDFLSGIFKRSFTKKMAYVTSQPLLIVPEK